MSITQAELDALKGYRKPPTSVVSIIGAVRVAWPVPRVAPLPLISAPTVQICVLLSEKPTWRVARGVISDPGFKARLNGLDPGSVKERNIHIVEKLIRANDLVANARKSNSRVRRPPWFFPTLALCSPSARGSTHRHPWPLLYGLLTL